MRKTGVTTGDVDALDEFLVVDEWDGLMWSSDSLDYTLDSVFLNLGSHTCDCGTTQVLEAARTSAFDVFPNPATGNAVWVKGEQAIREVVLHNLAGQQIGRQAVNGRHIVELSLSAAPSGMYLMEVHFENGARATRRVVRK